MKKQVEDWILLADKDLYAAEILLKDEYPLTNIVAFHCQQSIEKCLKAFLEYAKEVKGIIMKELL